MQEKVKKSANIIALRGKEKRRARNKKEEKKFNNLNKFVVLVVVQ